MSAIQNISLFVPHIYSNFTSAKVSEIFNGLHIGEVKSVDLVPKMDSNSKRYNAAYIHFTSWHNTKIAHDFQERLLDPKKEVKVMYDYPWYWIVLENKGKKHLPGDRKPRIDIEPYINRLPEVQLKPKEWIKGNKLETKCENNGFTQAELDWLDNQAELDKQRANMDDVSLTEHIKALKYEVEAANAKLNLTVSERNSFEERYIKEMVKNDTLMEILKDVNNKK
jgi:hypothetical protein